MFAEWGIQPHPGRRIRRIPKANRTASCSTRRLRSAKVDFSRIAGYFPIAMSHQSEKKKSPIPGYIGYAGMIVIPAVLVLMLGATALAFLSNTKGPGKPEEEETAAAKSAPAPAAASPAPTAPAPGGTGGETAPAAPAEAAPDPALMATGKSTFATCAACHGPDGKGIKTGPMLMAPSLSGSELLLGDPDAPILVVLKGIKKEGMDYIGQMLPLGMLTDEQLAGVLTYTRNSFGNSAPAVTPEMVKAAREKFSDVDAPLGVARAEIPQIVEAHK